MSSDEDDEYLPEDSPDYNSVISYEDLYLDESFESDTEEDSNIDEMESYDDDDVTYELFINNVARTPPVINLIEDASETASDTNSVISIDSENEEHVIGNIELVENEVIDNSETNNEASDKCFVEKTNEISMNTSTQIDSENCCIICTEMWTNSEAHHVVSLKCGHLFGKSCIENWLSPSRRTNRCPQCNKPAKKRDIHKIYARSLKPLDTWERDEAISKAKFWEEKSIHYETEFKKSEAKYKLLLQENDKLKLQLMNSVIKNNSKQNTINVNSISSQKNNSNLFQIAHVRDFDIREGNCRHLCYSKLIEALAISIPNLNHNNSLFPKYGIKKIPLNNSKSELIFMHNKPIKDMVINQYDGTLLTVSLDKTFKISSLISKSVISTTNLNNDPWSIHFCPSKKDLIYIGLKNGDIIVYDKRMLNQHLMMLSSSAKSPVVSLNSIEYDFNNSKNYGLMSVQLDTCSVYTFANSNNIVQSDYKMFKLPFEGKFSSSHFDSKSGLSLISCRPSQKHKRVTHYVFDFSYDQESSTLTPNIINVLEGGHEQIHLFKSKIYSNPLNEDSVLVCSGDESSNGALIWDCKSSYSQSITVRQPVLDIELIENRYYANSPLLSCLSDNVIKLYKIC